MKKILADFCFLLLLCSLSACSRVTVNVQTSTPQTLYAASLLDNQRGNFVVNISVSNSQPAEGYTISRDGYIVNVVGNDGAGVIYGVNRLKEILAVYGTLDSVKNQSDAPQMSMRGACVGLQKTEYLPGHKVYEYPYTPENFPWFYDRDLWIRYLDLLAASNFNSVYLWNGHPFASLVKTSDYPFAPEVDDETMKLNQDMFDFLVEEADRRGIRIIQMFYNIIVSKPFADHYGISTQDRNRPILPYIADYTRKSIAAFVERYPRVGFLVCLGEAMSGISNDIEWMTETIIPGIKDGLARSGRTDIPPIILRSHDTDCPRVLAAALPLYPNIYTMSKYTGESLTTYHPGGPWGETHRSLAAAAPVHIDNVHILANLEPWRWSSPAFTRKAVDAMHSVHGARGLHLYPQASYWDWPYTADNIGGGRRLLQIDRDWMWYAVWGRYAWSTDRYNDNDYWIARLSDYYGTDRESAANIIKALNESGEIAPKLIRRFGITEGNRQTLLLGMKMSQLVNPYKYTIYPGFYESCGPEGEKLIEYVEREVKHQPHVGELPLDIVDQCVAHAEAAVSAIHDAQPNVSRNKDEFARLMSDMECYRNFATAFRFKVLAAERVLRFKWSGNVSYLHEAIPFLEKSATCWKALSEITDATYLYANSMQTAQRRIPVGGNDGKFKTWSEMQTVYDAELANLRSNISRIENPHVDSESDVKNKVAHNAHVKILSSYRTVEIKRGARLYESRPEEIDSVAAELAGLNAVVLNRDTTRIVGATIEFESEAPVKMLVGFYVDDDPKFAAPPKLEVDAAGNEYGQAEPVISNAINMTRMPPVNIHAYNMPAGHHVVRLPKGIIMIAGFTDSELRPRDAGLNGAGDEVDWLFN